jgi:hypothetical protein
LLEEDPRSNSLGYSPANQEQWDGSALKASKDEAIDSLPENVRSTARNLRIAVEQMHLGLTKTRELILETARQLDEWHVVSPAIVNQSSYNGPQTNAESSATRNYACYPNVNLLSHKSDKYIGQDCTSCLELQDQVTQLKEVQIEVKVGQAGSISLSLCNDCIRKFSDENEIH